MERGAMNFEKRCRASFTLIELLLVVAVACVLIFTAVQGVGSVAQSMAVTTGATMLGDALTDGRSLAVAQNATVEVRIYDVPPQPGAAPVYDALQLRWVKTDRTTPPATPPVLLSTWVAIDATAAHSPLIASNSQSADRCHRHAA
jgi:Tfp pilus assembly protein PilE